MLPKWYCRIRPNNIVSRRWYIYTNCVFSNKHFFGCFHFLLLRFASLRFASSVSYCCLRVVTDNHWAARLKEKWMVRIDNAKERARYKICRCVFFSVMLAGLRHKNEADNGAAPEDLLVYLMQALKTRRLWQRMLLLGRYFKWSWNEMKGKASGKPSQAGVDTGHYYQVSTAARAQCIFSL